ncbi:MAG TPA: DnaJ C-terminal domain-containing protein [Tepidisphaeraceae bacterium]|jgi:DnaJ-class molecular chaperone
MAKRDYYEVLGVSRSADADEIKRAHRRLARKLHPDVNKDASASTKFAEVQEAYDVLSDNERKKKYDQFGHAAEGMGGGGGGGADDLYEQFRRQQGAAGRTVRPEDFNPADMGNTQFGDVFDQLFGGRGPFGRAGGRKRHPDPQRGTDVEHPVTLSFEQAARGTLLPLRLNLGESVETIDVKVPAGVKDGSRVRIKGKGDRSGGQPGDLFIVVSVLPHAYYKRSGLDVLLDVPLSVYEGLLGTRVTVPTLDGPVTLTIPPGTGSGAKLRIKGRGVKHRDEIGDQFCVIKIVLPKNLTPEDQKLITELQQRHPLSPRENIGW